MTVNLGSLLSSNTIEISNLSYIQIRCPAIWMFILIQSAGYLIVIIWGQTVYPWVLPRRQYSVQLIYWVWCKQCNCSTRAGSNFHCICSLPSHIMFFCYCEPTWNHFCFLLLNFLLPLPPLELKVRKGGEKERVQNGPLWYWLISCDLLSEIEAIFF